MSLSACAARERVSYLRGPRTTLSDYGATAKARAASETLVLEAYAEQAGLKLPLPPTPSDQWQYIVRAGINAIDEQCEKYIDVIFWADRELRTVRNEINLAGATTAALMGVFAAPADAIAATAAAFGFGNQGLANLSSGLLYEIQPSGIRKIVERSQAEYRKGVEERITVYNSRPAAVAAIQGYLCLCLPAYIETQINSAVAATNYQVDNNTTQNPVPNLKRVATTETVLSAPVEPPGNALKSIPKKRIMPTPSIAAIGRPIGCLADECLLSKSQVMEIQRALCLETVDGNFGTTTREAIAVFEESTEPVDIRNRQLNANESEALRSFGPCNPSSFKNAFERFQFSDKSSYYRAPNPALIRQLVNTLQDVDPSFTDSKHLTFDPSLREEIGKIQKQMGMKITKEVTKEFVDKLPVP
jgi:hypothetical protein